MHDVIACEDRGLPAVFLCTEPFMNAARDHAKACGNPYYQAVQVRYPLASLTPKQARARADEVLGGVLAILTGQARRVVTLGQAPHGPSRHDHVDDARAKTSHRGALFTRSTQEYLELLSV
jgi:hypothetical protein